MWISVTRSSGDRHCNVSIMITTDYKYSINNSISLWLCLGKFVENLKIDRQDLEFAILKTVRNLFLIFLLSVTQLEELFSTCQILCSLVAVDCLTTLHAGCRYEEHETAWHWTCLLALVYKLSERVWISVTSTNTLSSGQKIGADNPVLFIVLCYIILSLLEVLT